MDQDVRMRWKWVQMYSKVLDAGVVCRRCGISRPTLRKWIRRYQASGEHGLKSLSRRPHRSPNRKISSGDVEAILGLRQTRKLGARRLQNELQRERGTKYSLATIHKVLKVLQVKPLSRFQRPKVFKRYSRPIPGDRVQMDTCKIAPGLYQYTAIDDCSRYKVVGAYPRRTAANTLLFLADVIEEMPFPIQRIQTDRGREFFADSVQYQLMEYGIKFRPIKPRSPHLNGKVERAQKTDLQEFYTTVDLKDPNLFDRLKEWQHYHNWYRAHGSLNGKTPMDICHDLSDKTPFWDQVWENYDPLKERLQEQNYFVDLKLRKLKQSL
jgi:transposase InsO family protein